MLHFHYKAPRAKKCCCSDDTPDSSCKRGLQSNCCTSFSDASLPKTNHSLLGVTAARTCAQSVLQAKLARVFEMCEQQWEMYDPLCEEYNLLVACLRCWQARACHKKEKRHQMQQQHCADASRYEGVA